MDKTRETGTATAQPFTDEVENPVETGEAPTPDDAGDPKRRNEANKTTQRQE